MKPTKIKKHPQSKIEIKREIYITKYGSKWRKYIKERRTYPFGKKNNPIVSFEVKNVKNI